MVQGKQRAKGASIPIERITQAILLIRCQKVMLDADVAQRIAVATKALKRAVKRNIERFPGDFMFQLTAEEAEHLRYHIGTLKTARGQHRKCRRMKAEG